VRAAKFGGYKGYALAPYAERLKRWIAEQPHITPEQLRRRLVQRKVTIGIAAIFRFLRHLKLTFKKSPARGRTRPARRRRGAPDLAPKAAAT
jgi:hypothetical protein